MSWFITACMPRSTSATRRNSSRSSSRAGTTRPAGTSSCRGWSWEATSSTVCIATCTNWPVSRDAEHHGTPHALRSEDSASRLTVRKPSMPDTLEKHDADRLVEIDSGLLMELHRGSCGPYRRLVTFLGLYVVAAWSAYALAEALPWGVWTCAVLAPLVLLAAASLHGIS